MADMATTYATEEDDVLVGTNKADTIDGGAGDDIINSGAGDDIVYGGDGDDQINAGSGDDILDGSAGDDVLNGGGGSDTFRFHFGVTPGGSGGSLTYGHTPQEYDTNQNGVSSPEFEQFAQDYREWLDLNAPADYSYAAPQPNPLTSASSPDLVDGAVSSVPLTTGGQTRYWEPTIETAGSGPQITAADGDDTITQFQNAGPNVDKMEFYGITLEQAAQLFTLTTGDYDGDGYVDDSRLSWEGATDDADGSITIMGTTWLDLDAFLHSAQVEFIA